MEDVAKIADRVLVLKDGKAAMLDTVENVYSRGRELKEMGLNVPEVTDIFLKLHDMGIPCKTNIYTVEQAVEEFNRLKISSEVTV